MTTYTEQELIAAVQAGYHAPDDLPLATRSWLEGYRAGRSNPQPVVDADVLVNELSCLYWSAYNKGHNDTVEACYADVHTTDRFYYWMEQVKEIASEGDVPVVSALLKATVKESLTADQQPVVDKRMAKLRAFVLDHEYWQIAKIFDGRAPLHVTEIEYNALRDLLSAGKENNNE
jgi:hypothetical protein